MIRLWTIMFNLVLIISVGVLLRLGHGDAFKQNRLCKKYWLLKIQKLFWAAKNIYCLHATFVSLNKVLSFLTGQFFFHQLVYKGFCQFLFVFVLCVCLSVPLCSLRLTVILPPLPEVQCLNFLDILNPWGKVMRRSGLIFEIYAQKWCKIAVANFFKQIFSSFVHSVYKSFVPLPQVRYPTFLDIQHPWDKSNGKMWSLIWTFCFKMVSNQNSKKVFKNFCHLFTPFRSLFAPLPEVQSHFFF